MIPTPFCQVENKMVLSPYLGMNEEVKLEAQKSEVNSIFHRKFGVVGGYVFFPRIPGTPTTMLHLFMRECCTFTTFTLFCAVGLTASTVRMHAVKKLGDVVLRVWVDMAESDITLKLLEVEERMQMIGTKELTGPRCIIWMPKEETIW